MASLTGETTGMSDPDGEALTIGTEMALSIGETTGTARALDHGAATTSELTGTETVSSIGKTDGDNSTEDGLPALGIKDSEVKAGGQRLCPLEKFQLEATGEILTGDLLKDLGTYMDGVVHGLEIGTEMALLIGETTGHGETHGEVTGMAMESLIGETTLDGTEIGTEMESSIGETTSDGEVTGLEPIGTEMA
jgi:hypothetical protein